MFSPILLQVGSDVGDFLGLPVVSGLLGLTCFIGILLAALVGTLVYVRRRRGQPAPSGQTGPTAPHHDMPDLDLLVNPASFAPPPKAAAAAPTRAPRKGAFTVPLNDGGATEAVEVMTILRDVVDGGLIVQIGDKTYQNINNDTEFKDRFNRVMRELAQVVGKDTDTPHAPLPPTSAAPPPVEEAPSSLSDLMSPPEPPRPAQPKPASPSAAQRPGPLPGDLPSFRLEDNPMDKPKRGRKLDLKPVPELNIAGAIEAYLQHKLRQTPEYAERSIHIHPAPDGGVSIEVDGRFYEAVGDIAESDVREFIATAIQEWQDRH